MSNNKIGDFLIGDLDKWSKLNIVWEDLKEDFKENKIKMTGYFLLGLIPAFLFMYGISYVEKNGQFCEVFTVNKIVNFNSNSYFNNNTMNNIIMETELLNMEKRSKPIPESNHSYQWYLNYYEGSGRQPYVGLNCSFDLKRMYNNMEISKW